MKNSLARRNLIARNNGEHTHNFAQILIGWQGEVECEFRRGSRRLNNGIVAIVPNSTDHLFNGLSENSELLVVDVVQDDPYIQALEQTCQITLSETLFKQPEFISLTPKIIPLLDFAASQLLLSKDQNNPQLNCQIVSLFITQLCQIHSPNIPELNPVANKRLDAARMNDIIDRRLATPPSNLELANALYLSESHFYCICQHQFGLTPQQYVMSRRMQRANFMLLYSKKPLAVLASELGFSDASSFSRAYKKYYQEPPGRSRRSMNLGFVEAGK
ncbi:AraC family transcriptional regulator [Psychromonas sp. MB-3u-54]|uniref:AraC family transcriptional regulator n=1 Tax=Psychromonas sp. MB-3u-54 TaxID=2058319 RepID=UPI000C34A4B1|nr:AraC family transcriptional regulator [Psychromonas sp. MB-3u-54]PKH02533.1 AraC family transcriptional regulator [Psychromonas sp. MB-3u-54]